MTKYQDFMDDIASGAITDHCTKPSYFLRHACEILDDTQGYDSEHFHEAAHIMHNLKNEEVHHVDGFYFSNENEDDRASLSLIICDFTHENTLQRMTLEAFKAHFKRLRTFYLDCKRGKYDNWSPGTSKYDLMQIISKGSLPGYNGFIETNGTLYLHLITNKTIRHTPPDSEYITLPGGAQLTIHYRITDFNELSDARQKPVVLDFTKLTKAKSHPDGIPFLHAKGDSNVDFYDSYLFVMPADALAECYEKNTTSILEQNVRVYLQKKGKVNKGISRTIEEEPSVFFIYNNGLAITAEDIEFNEEKNRITRIHGLQVVNGGQTMASIYDAWKKKIDVSDITVQVKLTKIVHSLGRVIVPYISKYSNSQNAVKDTDQRSNETVQCCIEKLSRKVKTPGPIPQAWYYERLRGQYDNALLHCNNKSDFQKRYPKDKKLTPTKFGQAIMTFELMPYFVLKGEQKAYNGTAGMQGFSEMLSAVFSRNMGHIARPAWFKENTAKYIFLQQARNAIAAHLKRTENSLSTYTLAVTIYTLSVLVHLLLKKDRYISFQTIWENQKVDEHTMQEVIMVTDFVTDILAPRSDAAEWLKKESTWNLICEAAEKAHLNIKYYSNPLYTTEPQPFLKELSSFKTDKADFTHEQNLVMRATPDSYWQSLQKWLSEHNADAASMELVSKRFTRRLGTNQCRDLLELARKSETTGWKPPFNPQEEIDFSLTRTQITEEKGDILEKFISSHDYEVLVVERSCDLMSGSSCIQKLFDLYKDIEIEEKHLFSTSPEIGHVHTFNRDNHKKIVFAYTRHTKDSVHFAPILEVVLSQIASDYEGKTILLPYMGKEIEGCSLSQATKMKKRFKEIVTKELFKNPVTIMHQA